MFKLKIGKKGLQNAAKIETGCDITAGKVEINLLLLKPWIQNFVFGYCSEDTPIEGSLKGQIAKQIVDSDYNIWIIYKCRKLRRMYDKNIKGFVKGLKKAKKDFLSTASRDELIETLGKLDDMEELSLIKE